MKYSHCQSEHFRKNGYRRGKQNHLCLDCGRQFVENPCTQRGYSDDVRRICLRTYVNG
ncbi:MAG: IS1 family transposase, partial [Cyanobacteria bacterium P01_F01_bin.42]